MEAISFLWTELIIRPMLNGLVVLYTILFSNMGLAIITLTAFIRLITMPLTLKQLKQMRAMSALQPKLKEIQDRYSRDRSRVSQETMRLYREAGVSPLGCLGPMIVQMPVLIGLFRVLIQTVFSKPDDLVGLSEKLYAWIPIAPIYSAAPLNANFLWLDLSVSDPTNIIMPVLVFASTWVQQKMTMQPSTDPRQSGNQAMMLWLMPLMIAFFSFTLPSGLALYWVTSNVIGIAIQYFVTGGWGPLFPLFPKAAPAGVPAANKASQDVLLEESLEHGTDNRDSDERPNRRRSNRAGTERTRRRPRRGRGRNTK
ncbi:MAG: YidC/Oxa1 family membrane protein insertase [SAR202 cluster bacterium]|nr:YidC/Oxa1 family membrane protein insertase [Dehalococcoidia bacterium]MQG56066.1 YidC/Oxa1 family membrane protein insertase [SAR202 cluster bacterium]